ncbi:MULTISPECIES: PEP/pyruvate-binding domain-containing protein [Providencia]|uniref:PEP/pyruvate-binding domain-containing protein n=1 Tax=Providencia rettgeri TaxID=587 RepID=UPI000197C6A1|nr:PEP/pyruvate-binding domain-containing protein [Providencia rettgeri]EFE51487.1 pyruvate phosphate dikinase, PEP/pyruvate binding domain protein [Providencia rettgeri DSM 1131]QXA57964.1 sugar metabolism cluster protein [Providencia rettgeri]
MKTRSIILGAGAPHYGDQPTLLEKINGISVFDWLLDALTSNSDDIDLILGYQSDEIASKYPSIHIKQNKKWETTGSIYSLFQANLDDVDELIVCYGDLLFRDKLIRKLCKVNAPITIAWDSHWKQRYIDRSPEDIHASEKITTSGSTVCRLGYDIPTEWANGEFIGVVRFSGESLNTLRRLQKEKPEFLEKQNLAFLVEYLRVSGLSVSGYDVAGEWAEVNHPRDIAHFILGTKAETLARLRKLVSKATIQDQVSFTVADWKDNPATVINKIKSKFISIPLVVRSSARSEDAFTHSNAGAYTSVLNVDIDNGLQPAIEEVISSYSDIQVDDQVLVQPMLQQVTMSGVAFTRTLEKGAPYYVINYEESGSTDGITAGNTKDDKTLYVRRDATLEQVADKRLTPLVIALREIESLLSYDALDVEFAVDMNNEVHILQVRPIAVEQTKSDTVSNTVLTHLANAENKWSSLQQSPPHVLGNHTIFGVMPDWNPAEIIGTHPSELSQSLYRYLILNETWATQRAEYGYRDIRPQELLINFAGIPYIDVRASFNTFIPATISDSLSTKLVNFYLQWLKKHPHLHDKVEFDVVPTCLSLNFTHWESRLLKEAKLSIEEISNLRDGLKAITQNAILRTANDLNNIKVLEKKFTALQNYQSNNLLHKVWLLLEDCRLLGTLPFAHLARSGFVAVTLLKDAVTTGILSEKAQSEFMSSLRTVSHQLSHDAHNTAVGTMAWESFVKKYGHLRPGTYDITSSAYHDDPEKYLRPLLITAHEVTETKTTDNWNTEKSNFFDAIRSIDLNFTDSEIEQFLRDAIEGREESKFIFSRNLSNALDLLAIWAVDNGFDREAVSNLSIDSLLKLKENTFLSKEQIDTLKDEIVFKRNYRKVSLACELPVLLTSTNDFYSFLLQADQPNYIGSKAVQAPLINLDGLSMSEQPDVKNCIVLIPQADPGYDWLFGQGIVGLVTMYGGANSHMAIRSAEFDLPAAIGIGEQLYRQLSKGKTLELDPVNAQLRILH